jgi:hypothetical protein
VWPLGRTYVHSSDGALNTGPASEHHPRAAPDRTGPASDHPRRAAPDRPSPASDHRPRAAPARDGRREPSGRQPPPSGRPPLYQVGGRYRGDDWPTDPGFRRGDLGLDEEPGAGYAPSGEPEEPRHQEAWHAPDWGVRPAGPGRTEADKLDPGTWDSGAWDARDVYGESDGETDGGAYGDPGPPRPRSYGAGQTPAKPRPIRRDDPQHRPRSEPPGKPEGTERGWTRGITPAARIAAVEDAKLLAALQAIVERVKRVPSLYPRLLFVVVGYAAITSLAAAYAEKVPLPIAASLIVIPAAGVIFNMGMRHPAWGRRALVGWIAGIVATIIYDCLRLALVKVGIWGDPIPGIGRLVFSDPHANFAWGYLWRFLGNGGGMGIAYAMLPWRGWRTGVAYGTLICTGLIGLLYFFPVAQAHFFPLTPVTAIGGYAGHWVYGAVLGALTSWWLPPVELGRIHGRLAARLRHPGHRPRPSHARSSGSAAEDRFRRAPDRRSA